MTEREVRKTGSENNELDAAYADGYWSAYRQHIHTLLAWGYADSRHLIRPKHEEPDITGFLADAIQDRLDAIDSPSWCDQIEIKDDPPIRGGRRTGRNRWRPDLIFMSAERRPRARYHFEAKRLRKNQSVEDYLGQEGLLCFISGKYACESHEAGMLGYVQCDDILIWKERLQRKIDQDHQGTDELLLLSPQQDSQIVEAFPDEWISKHKRHIGQGIVIHHILLDYCVDSSHPQGSDETFE